MFGRCKNVLGEIDADVQNTYGIPLLDELMRFATSTRHSLPTTDARSVRGGEVPSIR